MMSCDSFPYMTNTAKLGGGRSISLLLQKKSLKMSNPGKEENTQAYCTDLYDYFNGKKKF